MAVFADNDFGDIGGGADAGFPFFMAFGKMVGRFAGFGLRFLVLNIVVFAIDEHDAVGVLLNRPGFTEVGHDRTFVVALFNTAVELGKGNDRQI